MCGWLAGCYEHVIREEGIGAKRDSIYEPNRSEPDLLDDAMWGSEGGTRQKKKK